MLYVFMAILRQLRQILRFFAQVQPLKIPFETELRFSDQNMTSIFVDNRGLIPKKRRLKHPACSVIFDQQFKLKSGEIGY